MTDFVEIKFHINPFEIWVDVLSQRLADIGFESFNQEEGVLKAYIREDVYEEASLQEIVKDLSEFTRIQYVQNQITSKNWNETWESNFEAVEISDRLYIRAPFHDSRPNAGLELVIMPKMSFGTGHHATTSMVAQAMLDQDFTDAKVLDVGCGTSILAILGEKLGASEVLAIDNDEWAVENSKENLVINNCTRITVEKAEIEAVNRKSFNIILANINRNVILNDMEKYVSLLASDGQLLLSGFRKEDQSLIERKAHDLNMSLLQTLEKDEWCMMHFAKG